MTKSYHADTEYIGKSGLDCIARSPAHYWERYLNPQREEQPETPAQVFGSLVHCLILEPHKYESRYVITPDLNKNTNAYKEWAAGFEGFTLIKQELYDTACRMRDAVMKSAGTYLQGGTAEKSIYANDPLTGARVKIKPDYFNTNLSFIVDVKTTMDARAEQFGRDLFNYRYHVQDAFYTDVAEWAGTPVNGFIFVAVEKEPPYGVAVYVLDDDSRTLGRETYRADLNVYAKCLETGIWHGYDPQPTSLRLPAWAWKKSSI